MVQSAPMEASRVSKRLGALCLSSGELDDPGASILPLLCVQGH